MAAGRTDVNVRPGGLSRHGTAESQEGDVFFGEVAPRPDSLRLRRADGHVEAPTMVEAHGAVDGALTPGAHRQRLTEMLEEGLLHLRQIHIGERAAAVEALGQPYHGGRDVGQAPLQFPVGLGRGGQFLVAPPERFGDVAHLAGKFSRARLGDGHGGRLSRGVP